MNKQCEICKNKYNYWLTKNSIWINLIGKKYKHLCLNCFTNYIYEKSKAKDEVWFLKLARYKKENK